MPGDASSFSRAMLALAAINGRSAADTVEVGNSIMSSMTLVKSAT